MIARPSFPGINTTSSELLENPVRGRGFSGYLPSITFNWRRVDGQSMQKIKRKEQARLQGELDSTVPEFVRRTPLTVGETRAQCGTPAPALDRLVWRML